MQQQQPMLSTQDFNMAAEIDPQNSDVYHHRGQVGLLLSAILVDNLVTTFQNFLKVKYFGDWIGFYLHLEYLL